FSIWIIKPLKNTDKNKLTNQNIRVLIIKTVTRKPSVDWFNLSNIYPIQIRYLKKKSAPLDLYPTRHVIGE
ncbi:hypothetical protein CGH83_21950, partial [Vibrio parahaemolyticus]